VKTLNSPAQVEDTRHKKKAADMPGLSSLVSVEAMIGAASADTQQWAGKETILLAEDEAFVRKATGEVLESAGYKVVIAGSAAQALEVHRRCSEQVDLLLADLVMPGISGHELANELVALCPQLRVLLMSGYAEQLALCQLSSYGKKYLAKPFSVPVLLRRVRQVLDTDPFDCRALA
jgi:two-component system, cell cycle sensor histidine kinase and response regulator CckA